MAKIAWTRLTHLLFSLAVRDSGAGPQFLIDAGAKSIMPPIDMFYGDRHGGVEDPSGNQWWIASRIEDLSPEDFAKRAGQLSGKR